MLSPDLGPISTQPSLVSIGIRTTNRLIISYFTCGVIRLGLKVAFIVVYGKYIFGRFILVEIQKRNMNLNLFVGSINVLLCSFY